MNRHVGGANQRPAGRGGRAHYGIGVDPVLQEGAVILEGEHVVADDEGHDRGLRLPDVESQPLELADHARADRLQALHVLRFLLHDAQGRGHRGNGARRHAGAEDERTGVVLDVIDHLRGAGDEAADGSERLGKGAHQQVGGVMAVEVLLRTAPGRADHPQRVRFVHVQAGAVTARERADLRQRGDVSFHGKHPVGHDQLAAALHRAQQALQLVEIVVVVAVDAGAAGGARGQQHAVHQRAVIEAVGEHVIAAPGKRLQRAQVGLVAGGEAQRGRLAHEVRQLLFQLLVEAQGAVEEARPGATGAVAAGSLDRRLDDAPVPGEAKVVVRPDHDQLAAVDDDARTAIFLNRGVVGVEADGRYLGSLVLLEGPHLAEQVDCAAARS